jgi:hypothetical protein
MAGPRGILNRALRIEKTGAENNGFTLTMLPFLGADEYYYAGSLLYSPLRLIFCGTL